jgi:hypothetical protein
MERKFPLWSNETYQKFDLNEQTQSETEPKIILPKSIENVGRIPTFGRTIASGRERLDGTKSKTKSKNTRATGNSNDQLNKTPQEYANAINIYSNNENFDRVQDTLELYLSSLGAKINSKSYKISKLDWIPILQILRASIKHQRQFITKNSILILI